MQNITYGQDYYPKYHANKLIIGYQLGITNFNGIVQMQPKQKALILIKLHEFPTMR